MKNNFYVDPEMATFSLEKFIFLVKTWLIYFCQIDFNTEVAFSALFRIATSSEIVNNLRIVDCNYLRQVNEVNGGDNAFVRCVCVCLFVCAQRPVNGS